jgi:hypothetical protein
VALWSAWLASATKKGFGLVVTQTRTSSLRLGDAYARLLAGHHRLLRAGLAGCDGEVASQRAVGLAGGDWPEAVAQPAGAGVELHRSRR